MAGKLAQVATVETTTELDLKPALRRKLMTRLKNYQHLAAAIKALKGELAAELADVESIRETLGLKKFGYEGFKVSRVEGQQEYFDKQYCVTEGWLTQDQIEEATRTKPKKPYTRISVPGERDYDKESE